MFLYAIKAYKSVSNVVDVCPFLLLHKPLPRVLALGGVMAQLRIGDETHEVLRELARLEGASMQTVLDKALAEYQKKAVLRFVRRGLQCPQK